MKHLQKICLVCIVAALLFLPGCEKEERNLNVPLISLADSGTAEPPKEQYSLYEQVGIIGAGDYPVFEVVSTLDSAKTDAETAMNALTGKLPDITFFFFVVDEEERFLGKGSKDGYVPYVYKENYESFSEPPYCVPFKYYFAKYFNGIEYNGYESNDSITYGGLRIYEFSINVLNQDDYKKCKAAAEKIRELMNLTLGDQYKIVIKVYEGTDHEICAETPGK